MPTKGGIPWNKGLKLPPRTKEHREKLRKALRGHIGFWLGKKRPPYSKEWRRKQSESHKNQTKGVFKVGHQGWGKGMKRTDEVRKKISLAHRGKPKPNQSADKHWHWKGGITKILQKLRHSLEYKIWRKAVFERDDYRCVWCGARSGKGKAITLNADHIKSFAYYPELRFAIDNGRTLCVPCHKTTESYLNPHIKER